MSSISNLCISQIRKWTCTTRTCILIPLDTREIRAAFLYPAAPFSIFRLWFSTTVTTIWHPIKFRSCRTVRTLTVTRFSRFRWRITSFLGYRVPCHTGFAAYTFIVLSRWKIATFSVTIEVPYINKFGVECLTTFAGFWNVSKPVLTYTPVIEVYRNNFHVSIRAGTNSIGHCPSITTNLCISCAEARRDY